MNQTMIYAVPIIFFICGYLAGRLNGKVDNETENKKI